MISKNILLVLGMLQTNLWTGVNLREKHHFKDINLCIFSLIKKCFLKNIFCFKTKMTIYILWINWFAKA